MPGSIIADAYEASIVGEGPAHRIAPATRRAVLLRFAQAAADRLHGAFTTPKMLSRMRRGLSSTAFFEWRLSIGLDQRCRERPKADAAI